MAFVDWLRGAWRGLDWLIRWMEAAERYMLEIGLIVGSLWAAYALYVDPPNFEVSRGAFEWIAGVVGEEYVLATIALLGGALNVIGLAAMFWWPFGSSLARLLGLAGSGFLFYVLAISFWLGSRDSVSIGALFMCGVGATWRLLILHLPRRHRHG